MQNNYTILSVWGIPIRVNISLLVFLPILAWLIGSGEQLAAYAFLIEALTPATIDPSQLTSSRWLIGIAAGVGLFGSVTAHELGHAWVAMRYDIGVDSITLWVLGGLADLSEMPREWYREFWIAIAGPLTSLLVAGVSFAGLLLVPVSAPTWVFLAGFFVVVNVGLATFNLLPAFPMDGGRILRALLARNRSYLSATRTAARIGTWFALLFAVLGIVVTFSPMLLLLAVFIYVAATSESRSVLRGELLAGLTASDLLSQHEPVAVDTTLRELSRRLLSARRADLAVVDEAGNFVGVVSGTRISEIPPEDHETTRVQEIMTADLPRIDAATSAVDVLSVLLEHDKNVAVVEQNGSPCGFVSRADFNEVLTLRKETGPF